MKFFITQLLKNISLVVLFFVITNLFRTKDEQTLYKLLDTEHIIVLVILSSIWAGYTTYKKSSK